MPRRLVIVTAALWLLAGQAIPAAEETSPTMTIDAEWEKLAEGLEFPEGPAWDGADTLYFSSCDGGYVSKIGPEGYAVVVPAQNDYAFYERTNGLAVGRDGWIYACEWGQGRGAIHRISPAGVVEQYVSTYAGEPFRRPNDLAFDPYGNLYFTDPSSYGADKPDGILYRVDARTREVRIAADDLCFCNGLAFSADGKLLYLAESAKKRVLIYDVAEDGSLSNRRVLRSGLPGDPDGMAVDVEGNLWVAVFGGGAVQVIATHGARAGELLFEIKTPGRKPSNIDFAGEDMKTLYVTEDETNAVYRTRVQIAGLKLFWHPARAAE